MAVTREELNVKITVDFKDGKKVVKDVTANFKDLDDALKQASRSSDKLEKAQSKALSSIVKQNERLELAIMNVGKSEVERIQNTLKFTEKEIKARLENAEAGSKVADELQKRLDLERRLAAAKVADNIEKTNQALEKQKDALMKTADEAEEVSGAFSRVGANLITANQALELAQKAFEGLRRAVDFTFRSFAEFEQGIVGVVKTANLSAAETEKFTGEIIGLSQAIPSTTTNLLQVSKAAGQLGVQAKDITKFTETIVRLQSATDLVGEEAAIATSRVLGLTNFPTEQVDFFGSALVNLGNNLRANEREILRTATIIAQGIGVYDASADAVLALAGASRDLGIRFELAGSALTRAFIEINENLAEGGRGMKILSVLTGIAGDAIKESFAADSVGFFRKFLGGLNQLEKSQVPKVLSAIGLEGVEINRVLPTLAKNIDRVDLSFELAKAGITDTTFILEESNRSFATVGAAAQLLQNSVANVGIQLGRVFRPIIVGVFESLKDFADGITKSLQKIEEIQIALKDLGAVKDSIGRLAENLLKAGAATAIFVAAMKPSLVLAFAGAIKTLAASVSLFAGATMIAATSSLTAFAAALGTALAPLAAAAPLIAAVSSAILLLSMNIDRLGAVVSAVFSAINLAAFSLLEGIASIGAKFLPFLDKVEDALGSVADSADKNLNKAVSGLRFGPFDMLLEKLANATTEIVGVSDATQELINKQEKISGESLDKVGESAKNAGNAVSQAAEELTKFTEAQLNQMSKISNQLSAQNQRLVADIIAADLEGADLIDFRVAMENEALDLKMRQWKEQGILNDKMQAQIEKQKELNLLRAQQKKEQPVGIESGGDLTAKRDKLRAKLAREILAVSERIKQVGMTENELIFARVEQQNAALELRMNEARVSKVLTNELEKQFDEQIRLNEALAKKLVMLREEQALDKIKKKNLQLEQSIAMIGKDRITRIKQASKFQEMEQQAIIDKIRAQGILSKAEANRVKDLEKGIDLIRKRADKQIEVVIRQEQSIFGVEDVAKIERNLGSVAGAIASGVNAFAGAAVGFAGAANMFLDGILALVNAGPALIDKLASVFDTLTSFPETLLKSLNNLISSIGNFIANAIPNIISAIPELIKSVFLTLPETINKAFIALFNKLPKVIADALDAFIDSVPDIVAEFISGGIEMAGSLVRTLIMDAPRIAVALSKAMAVELPIAIVQGIARGIDDIIEAFANGFDFSDQLKEQAEDFARAITGVSEQLFTVQALDQEAQGVTTADKIRDALSSGAGVVESAFNRFKDWMRDDFGRFFAAGWKSLKDFFEFDLPDLVKAAFQGVDNFFRVELGGFISSAFKGLVDFLGQVPKALGDLFTGLFSNLGPALLAAGEGLLTIIQNIWEPFQRLGLGIAEALSGPFETAREKVIDPLKEAFTGLFKFFEDLPGTLKTMLTNLGPDMANFFSGALTSLETGLKNLSPENLLKKLFPDDDSGKGKIEEALGTDIPYINFASGGLVPGRAKVSGDSEQNDTVLSLLSPGEFVLSRTQVAELEKTMGTLPKFSSGGLVDFFKNPGGAVSSGAKSALGQITESLGIDLDGIYDLAMKELTKQIAKLWNVEYSTGGFVDQRGRVDPGEFVINRAAVKSVGPKLLNQINDRQFQGGGNTTVNVNMTVNTTQKIDENLIRAKVMPTVKRELKRASLDGDFIISQRGIRS